MGFGMSAANRRRRLRWQGVAISAIPLTAALAVALGWLWLGRASLLPPPVVELTGVDPAVCRAVENARAAILHNPGSAENWGMLGMVLRCHDLSVEASNACFAQAERLDPRQPRWPYLQATSVLTANPEAAIAKLHRAVELCDCDPDTPRLELGEVLLEQGRFQEAAEQFRRVLQCRPGNARASLGLGRLADEHGELSVSIAHLDHCLADSHTRQAATILLAHIHERLGNRSAAEQTLRKAAELPKDAAWPDSFQEEVDRLRVGKQVSLAAADHLIRQARYGDALGLLHQAVQDYPDSAWAWSMVGKAHLGNNDVPAAERALRKAAELGPDRYEVHFYLGVALLLQKKYPAAAHCLRKATELKPDFADAHYDLGHSLKEQGDEVGAIAAFRTALHWKPEYGAAHVDLANLLLKRGQKDEALVHVRHAVRLNPTNPEAKHLLDKLQQ